MRYMSKTRRGTRSHVPNASSGRNRHDSRQKSMQRHSILPVSHVNYHPLYHPNGHYPEQHLMFLEPQSKEVLEQTMYFRHDGAQPLPNGPAHKLAGALFNELYGLIGKYHSEQDATTKRLGRKMSLTKILKGGSFWDIEGDQADLAIPERSDKPGLSFPQVLPKLSDAQRRLYVQVKLFGSIRSFLNLPGKHLSKAILSLLRIVHDNKDVDI